MSTTQSSLPFKNRGASQHKCYCWDSQIHGNMSKGHKLKQRLCIKRKVSGSPWATKPGAIWKVAASWEVWKLRTETQQAVSMNEKEKEGISLRKKAGQASERRTSSTWVTWGCDCSFNQRRGCTTPGSLRRFKETFHQTLKETLEQHLEDYASEIWYSGVIKHLLTVVELKAKLHGLREGLSLIRTTEGQLKQNRPQMTCSMRKPKIYKDRRFLTQLKKSAPCFTFACVQILHGVRFVLYVLLQTVNDLYLQISLPTPPFKREAQELLVYLTQETPWFPFKYADVHTVGKPIHCLSGI